MEFDEPYLLLKTKDSLFSKMVEHTSAHLATNLYEVARQAYFLRHELTDDSDLDMLPRFMDCQSPFQQQPNDDDDLNEVQFRGRGSSVEKDRLLFESTV